MWTALDTDSTDGRIDTNLVFRLDGNDIDNKIKLQLYDRGMHIVACQAHPALVFYLKDTSYVWGKKKTAKLTELSTKTLLFFAVFTLYIASILK